MFKDKTSNKLSFSKIVTPFNMIVVAIFCAVLYVGFMYYKDWSTVKEITNSAAGHTIKVADKPADLQVTLFYDYQCPFCYQIDPIIRSAAEQDGGVELIFKFLPFFGEKSEQMAHMAYAAGQQGKFLELHDYFMKNGAGFDYSDETVLNDIISMLGVDRERFLGDMNSKAARKKVEDNRLLAMSLNVYSTPTLYIGDQFYIPEHSMPNDKKIMDMFDEARQRR